MAHGFRGSVAILGREVDEKLTRAILRSSRSESMAEKIKLYLWIRVQGYGIEKVIEHVSDLFSLSRQHILNPSRQRAAGYGSECIALLVDPGVGYEWR